MIFFLLNIVYSNKHGAIIMVYKNCGFIYIIRKYNTLYIYKSSYYNDDVVAIYLVLRPVQYKGWCGSNIPSTTPSIMGDVVVIYLVLHQV